jgi:hypothetical protein
MDYIFRVEKLRRVRNYHEAGRFDHENGSDVFLRNVSLLSRYYTVLYLRREK